MPLNTIHIRKGNEKGPYGTKRARGSGRQERPKGKEIDVSVCKYRYAGLFLTK